MPKREEVNGNEKTDNESKFLNSWLKYFNLIIWHSDKKKMVNDFKAHILRINRNGRLLEESIYLNQEIDILYFENELNEIRISTKEIDEKAKKYGKIDLYASLEKRIEVLYKGLD